MRPGIVAAAYLILVLWVLWESWLVLEWRRRAAAVAHRCQVAGCDGRGYGTVARGIEVMRVCYDHSCELTEIFGWAQVQTGGV